MTANKKFFVFKIYVPENIKKKGFVSWYDTKKGRLCHPPEQAVSKKVNLRIAGKAN